MLVKLVKFFRPILEEMNMHRKNHSGFRWTFLLGYIGILAFLMGCMGIAAGSSNLQQGILQLDDGVIVAQAQNGDLTPVAGVSTFELVGNVENTNPWTVAGRALATNESTRIEEGLQVGDRVRVRGAVMENDVWLAYSIERAEEQRDPIITLIGRVSSIDPWVVNGITLNVTDETVIEGEIAPGMLVLVEILLLEDGTWEVLRIALLGDLPETSGCATVTATIESVNGNQIQFLGWPTTVTFDGTDEVDLSPGQKVLVVVCVTEDGILVIRQIIILDTDDDDDDDTPDGGEKVLVCHKPDKKGGHTLSISSSAVPAHLGHGDKLGPCP